MSIVFVTGGSGFVGSHLIARLVARGDTVRALSRSDRSDQQLRGLGAEPVRVLSPCCKNPFCVQAPRRVGVAVRIFCFGTGFPAFYFTVQPFALLPG